MTGAPLLRRTLGALRVSRFEAKIAVALVVAATLPLLGALFLAGRVAGNLALGLDPRVVERLEAVPGLYGDLFQARKQLYAEQARALARGLPSDRKRAEAYLQRALEPGRPRLRRAVLYAASGAVVAEAETQTENPEGEWREAPARVALPAAASSSARSRSRRATSRSWGRRASSPSSCRAWTRSVPGSGGATCAAFALLLLAWAAGAAAVGILLARRTTRRVTRLVEAVRRLAGGDLAVQVDRAARTTRSPASRARSTRWSGRSGKAATGSSTSRRSPAGRTSRAGSRTRSRTRSRR